MGEQKPFTCLFTLTRCFIPITFKWIRGDAISAMLPAISIQTDFMQFLGHLLSVCSKPPKI